VTCLTWINAGVAPVCRIFAHCCGSGESHGLPRPIPTKRPSEDDAHRHPGEVPKSAGQVLAEGREKRRLRRELDECDQRGELDAVLADLGIARGSLRQLIGSCARSPRLLAAMTDRLGIDRGALHRSPYAREIERNCTLCTEHCYCRAWFQSGATTGNGAFCPNAALFDAIKAEMTPPT